MKLKDIYSNIDESIWLLKQSSEFETLASFKEKVKELESINLKRMELTFKQFGKLQDSKKEFLDLNNILDIEISNIDNPTAKANMLKTKFKTLKIILEIEKQINNI